METSTEDEILIITTHYPFGVVEENWIEPEIDKFTRCFKKVYVLPVKALGSRREMAEGTELWPPLAGSNRIAFFARQAMRLRTWKYFVSAARECAAGPGLNVSRAVVCFKFASYRAALEANPRIDQFLSSPIRKIVYAYWGHFAALIIPKAQMKGALTCVRYHASDLYVHRPETFGFYPWRQQLRQLTDFNAFISEHGRNYFYSIPHSPTEGISDVCRLGCRDFGNPRGRRKARSQQNIVMVSASWIHPIKRVEEIAKLAGAIGRSRPVTWHHFGGGENEAVSQAVEAARADGARIVLHGVVEVADLQRFYRDTPVTFFVNLSRDEGIPVSIMEAMNADIPIVATAVGGTAEVVLEGFSGILVDPSLPGGPDELACRILSALEPDGILNKVRPRKVWESLCNAEQLAIGFARKLQDLSTQKFTGSTDSKASDAYKPTRP